MLKMDDLASRNSCLNKAASDEPVFVLRAKDPLAAQTGRRWATMAANAHEAEKVNEAMALADAMDEWRDKKSAPVVANTATGFSVKR